MSDQFEKSFPNLDSKSAYGNHDIQDENDIFEKEKEVNYQPPAQDISIFDHPTYRSTTYEKTEQNPEQEVPVSSQVPGTQSVYKTQETSLKQENNQYETYQEASVQKSGSTQAPYNSYQVGNTHTMNEAAQQEPKRTAYPNQGMHNPQKATPGYENNMQNRKPIPPKKKDKKEKKKGGFWKKLLTCIVLAIVFGAVSGGIFLGVTKLGGKAMGIEEQQSSQPPVIDMVGESKADDEVVKEEVNTVPAASDVYTVAQVAERCMPAMVGITNKSIQEVPNYFGFGAKNYESESSGSGIIIGQTEAELLIATNNHVISGANTLTVCFVDDELVNAIIKGTDAENDLAVISVNINDIKPETLNAIKVIELGDSDALKVGEQVVAIGNALGYGQSVSSGYISALNREVTIDNTTFTLMQTDAAINPGNSGGALLNMKGQLIGINESKYADTAVEGMGYAIPISTATPILSNLMSRETRHKVDAENASYLGISCKDISAEFAEMYNVPTGVYIDSVVDGGPAAMAGLQKGDIITMFDGVKIGSYSDLISQLEYYAAGEIVEIVFYRTNDGVYAEQSCSIVLGARSESELANQGSQSESSEDIQEEPNMNDPDIYGYPDGFDIFDFFGF